MDSLNSATWMVEFASSHGLEKVQQNQATFSKGKVFTTGAFTRSLPIMIRAMCFCLKLDQYQIFFEPQV